MTSPGLACFYNVQPMNFKIYLQGNMVIIIQNILSDVNGHIIVIPFGLNFTMFHACIGGDTWLVAGCACAEGQASPV